MTNSHSNITLEGVVVAESRGMRPTLTIETDDGLRYWGTWPTSLYGPESLIGYRVGVGIESIDGDVEYKQPRKGWVIA